MRETTGNYVADVVSVKETCGFCEGEGEFNTASANRERESEKAKAFVRKFYDCEFVRSFSQVKALWRRFEKMGSERCPNCSGRGVVEVDR